MHLAEVRRAEDRLAEVGPVEGRSVEVRPEKVRPGEVGSAEVRLAEVRPGEVGPAEVRPDPSPPLNLDERQHRFPHRPRVGFGPAGFRVVRIAALRGVDRVDELRAANDESPLLRQRRHGSALGRRANRTAWRRPASRRSWPTGYRKRQRERIQGPREAFGASGSQGTISTTSTASTSTAAGRRASSSPRPALRTRRRGQPAGVRRPAGRLPGRLEVPFGAQLLAQGVLVGQREIVVASGEARRGLNVEEQAGRLGMEGEAFLELALFGGHQLVVEVGLPRATATS